MLNNRSSIKSSITGKNFGHDVSALYDELTSYAGELLPGVIPKPNELRIFHWRAESMEGFVKRLAGEGDANNRYQIFGFSQQNGDIYKLDRLVFAVRRLCCPLDAYYMPARNGEYSAITNRDMLKSNTEYQPHFVGSRFARLSSESNNNAVRHAAFEHNLLFAPEDYQHGSVEGGYSSSNSVLWRSVLLPAEQGKKGVEAQHAVHVLDWIMKNIQLPKNVKKQLAAARKKMTT